MTMHVIDTRTDADVLADLCRRQTEKLRAMREERDAMLIMIERLYRWAQPGSALRLDAEAMLRQNGRLP